MDRRQIGTALLVLAAALWIGAWWMWSNRQEQADHDRRVAAYTESLTGRDLDEVGADPAAPIAIGVLGAVAAISGVIVLVSERPSPGS